MMNYVCLYLLPTSKAASWLVTMLMNSQKPFYNYKDYFETLLAEEDDLEKVNTARNLMTGEIPDPFTEPDAIFDPTFISQFFCILSIKYCLFRFKNWGAYGILFCYFKI